MPYLSELPYRPVWVFQKQPCGVCEAGLYTSDICSVAEPSPTIKINFVNFAVIIRLYRYITEKIPLCPEHRRHLTLWMDLYTGVSDVTVICGHTTISMLWGNTAYCAKLGGEDLARCANKIESVSWLKKMSALSPSYYESDVTITNMCDVHPRRLLLNC